MAVTPPGQPGYIAPPLNGSSQGAAVMPAGTTGFERVWLFRVRPGLEGQFEELYGPEGAWARLLARHPGIRKAMLERVPNAAAEYLLTDRWESRLAWDIFRPDTIPPLRGYPANTKRPDGPEQDQAHRRQHRDRSRLSSQRRAAR